MSVPVRAPPTEGVKVTVTLHLLPAGREDGQAEVSAKSPVIVTLFTATAVALALVTVIA